MLKKCKVVGLKNLQKSKEKGGDKFSILYLDVTPHVKGDNAYGQIIDTAFYPNHIKSGIIGEDVLCSLDMYGTVKDVEIE